jgi:hypothetical protein
MPVCNSRYAKLAGENRIIRRKYVLKRSLKEFIGEKYEKLHNFSYFRFYENLKRKEGNLK